MIRSLPELSEDEGLDDLLSECGCNGPEALEKWQGSVCPKLRPTYTKIPKLMQVIFIQSLYSL